MGTPKGKVLHSSLKSLSAYSEAEVPRLLPPVPLPHATTIDSAKAATSAAAQSTPQVQPTQRLAHPTGQVSEYPLRGPEREGNHPL